MKELALSKKDYNDLHTLYENYINDESHKTSIIFNIK